MLNPTSSATSDSAPAPAAAVSGPAGTSGPVKLWFCPQSIPGRGSSASRREFESASIAHEYVRGINTVAGYPDEFEIMRDDERSLSIRFGCDGDRRPFRFETAAHKAAFIKGLADAQGLDAPGVFWPGDAEYATLERHGAQHIDASHGSAQVPHHEARRP
jgi:hypothetical protein